MSRGRMPRTALGNGSSAPSEQLEGDSKSTRIQSVARAAKILMLIANLPESDRTMARLAQELGTSVPTVYHLVNTLSDSRLLTRDLQRRIHLGPAVATLGTAYSEQTAIPTEYLDVLKVIVDFTGENAYFSAWRDHNIVILAHMSGTHSVLVSKLREGFHGYAHARASGKVLLAFAPKNERDAYLASNSLQRATAHTITNPQRFSRELETVANQGYATEEEEFAEGVACISVPVRNAGVLIGAFTLTAPLDRYHAKVERYLLQLRECVAQVDC